MLQLAIATSREYAQYHPDDSELVAHLPTHGLHPRACVWDDPSVAWERFDAVLVRTVWDYYRHYPQFLAWLARLERDARAVLNPVATMRWNADKHYLLDLERAGVETIRAHVATSGTLARAIAALGERDVVVKPTLGAGAWHTFRATREDAAAHEPAFAELLAHSPALVQPYVPEVASEGEWSLLYFGGEFSHAVLKRPARGDFRVQEKHGGSHEDAVAKPEWIAEGRAILGALRELGHAGTAYARIDAVPVAGRLQLMELELIEPQLFLRGRPQAAAMFARVLAHRVGEGAASSTAAL